MEGLPGSGESFADDYLPHLLTRAAQAADAKFTGELRQLRVQRPVWWALAVLSEAEATTVTELANRCALQQPTATTTYSGRFCWNGCDAMHLSCSVNCTAAPRHVLATRCVRLNICSRQNYGTKRPTASK